MTAMVAIDGKRDGRNNNFSPNLRFFANYDLSGSTFSKLPTVYGDAYVFRDCLLDDVTFNPAVLVAAMINCDTRKAKNLSLDNVFPNFVRNCFEVTGSLLPASMLKDVPVVVDIDEKIFNIIHANPRLFSMRSYHKPGKDDGPDFLGFPCGTSHCRAGWAIALAGKAALELENKYGSNIAGALIYAASRPDQPIPNFFCSNERALVDLLSCVRSNTRGGARRFESLESQVLSQ